jgi:hypothetical protein
MFTQLAAANIELKLITTAPREHLAVGAAAAREGAKAATEPTRQQNVHFTENEQGYSWGQSPGNRPT